MKKLTIEGKDIKARQDNASIIEHTGIILSDANWGCSLSFDDVTRTLTITPDTEIPYLLRNEKGVITTVKTTVIPDISGLYFVYISDLDGTIANSLASSSNIDDFIIDNVALALVYWNSGKGKGLWMQEFHGCDMPGAVHRYEHLFEGAKWLSGGTLSFDNIDGDGTLDADCEGTISQGVYHDEDNIVTCPQSTNFKFFWLDDTGFWNWEDGNGSFVLPTGAGLAAYNPIVGGLGSKVEATTGRFLIYFSAMLNNCEHAIFLAQEEYLTLVNAENAIAEALDNLYTIGFPTPEIIFTGAYIVQTKTSYSNTYKSRIVSTDYGEYLIPPQEGSTASPTPTSFLNLTDRYIAGMLDVEYGTYTPTFSNLSNLDSVTSLIFYYQRIGNQVMVKGTATVDPTAAGAGSFEMTIPISSDFNDVKDAIGTICNHGDQGLVSANIANDTAEIDVDFAGATSATMCLDFWYVIK